MEKIYTLQKALNDVGIKTELYHDNVAYCFDGRLHRGIELVTNFNTGEDNLSFVFHPNTHKLVKDYLDCPVVKENF